MPPRRTLFTILIGLAILTASAERAAAQMGDLVGLLTSQLGVTGPQAAGGAGALFGHAKQQLSAPEFGKVASAMPGVDDLISAAPTGGGGAGALGSAGSLLGGSSAGGGSLAGLAGPFSQLGMSPDMIGKFVPVVLDYAKGSGGQEVLGLLQGVLLPG